MNIIEKINQLDIYLASNSPRRQQLLTDTGIVFKTLSGIEVDETIPPNLPAEDVALSLAVKKNKAYQDLKPQNSILITADTVVIADGKILNKPKDKAEAVKMLQTISDKQHKVLTGVCIHRNNQEQYTFTETSNVEFEKLSPDEIEYYIENYKPFDKAGAYGIQEWIGHTSVRKIEGSFNNIVGFPINKVYKTLKIIVNNQ